jgi:hypothetical protein
VRRQFCEECYAVIYCSSYLERPVGISEPQQSVATIVKRFEEGQG